MAGFAAIFLMQMTTVSALAAGSPQVGSDMQVVGLRCEYLVDPLGIDVAQPRLSWKLQSPWRGQKQTAYQILVAGSEEMLKDGNADLWDTGKVASDRSIHVVYGGKPLSSRTRCCWITEGATTLWEQWDGNASRNHIMFGHISAWFYQVLGGIMPDSGAVGFKHFIIKPQLLGDMKWVRAQHESMYGTIKSSWEIQGDKFILKIAVPVNTTATVYVPSDKQKAGVQGSDTIRTDDHVRFVRAEGNYAVYEVDSGSYEFISPLPQ